MKEVTFKVPGPSKANYTRVLSRDDLEKKGVTVDSSALVDGQLQFTPQNNHTIKMSDKASDSLVNLLPSEFTATESEKKQPSLFDSTPKVKSDDSESQPKRVSRARKKQVDESSGDDELV